MCTVFNKQLHRLQAQMTCPAYTLVLFVSFRSDCQRDFRNFPGWNVRVAGGLFGRFPWLQTGTVDRHFVTDVLKDVMGFFFEPCENFCFFLQCLLVDNVRPL